MVKPFLGSKMNHESFAFFDFEPKKYFQSRLHRVCVGGVGHARMQFTKQNRRILKHKVLHK